MTTTNANQTNSAIQKVSKFIIHLWKRDEDTHSHFQSELEGLLAKKVTEDLTESEEINLAALEKSFDFNVEYSIDSWWEIEAPHSVNAPTFTCESFEQAREIMIGDEDLEEPSQYDIADAANIDVVDIEETDLIVDVSNMELKTNA